MKQPSKGTHRLLTGPRMHRTLRAGMLGAAWLVAIALLTGLARPLPLFAGSGDGGINQGAPVSPPTPTPPSVASVSIQGQSYPVTISAVTEDGAPYTGGWANQSIAVSWQCGGGAHNGAKSPESVVLGQDRANQSVPITCADADGNSGSVMVDGFSIDKAPPKLTCSAVPASIWPADGRAVPVTVSVRVDDSLSGPAGFTPLSTTASGNPSDAQGFDAAGAIASPPDVSIAIESFRGEVLANPGDSYVLSYQGTNNAGDAATCKATIAVQPISADEAGTDGPANAWSYGASLPTSRSYLAAATGADGRIYAIGGDVDGQPVGTVEAYDPTTNSWTAAASLPTPRAALAAATGADGRIYAFGGDVDGQPVGTVEAYDPTTNTWATVASLSTPRRNLAAATGTDGRIYAIGGAVLDSDSGTFGPSTVVEAYDPGSNTWTTVASMPAPLSRLGAATGTGGQIYGVAGQGCGKSSPDSYVAACSGPTCCDAQANLEIYDPSTNTWSAGPDRPLKGRAEQVAVVSGTDGRVYALGGSIGLSQGISSGLPQDTAYAYDPRQGTWTSVGPLPAPRFAAAAAVGQDGRIYVIGGEQGPSEEPTLQIYDPTRWSGAANSATP